MGTDPFNADFPTGSPANQVIPASSPTSRTTILPACRRTCPGPSHGRVGDRQPFPHIRATCVRGYHDCHQRGLGAVPETAYRAGPWIDFDPQAFDPWRLLAGSTAEHT